MKRFLFLLAVILLVSPALASAALLSPEALDRLSAGYMQFAGEVADELIESGLLDEADRQDWLDYQLADFMLNGGYGSMQILYNPDLLGIATWNELALTLNIEKDGAALTVSTLRGWDGMTALPGLPFDFALYDAAGALTDAVFTVRATRGRLLLWDASQDEAKPYGFTAQSRGEWVFWDCAIELDAECTIVVECKSAETDEIIMTAGLKLICDGERWAITDEE
ncbi:MAG: hypothetical protein LBD16_04360 [Oscillospiraceae bacterium]|jgi:hypothetical protein|nr:hypothetical protein [Oscillospiraceae bacterium]